MVKIAGVVGSLGFILGVNPVGGLLSSSALLRSWIWCSDFKSCLIWLRSTQFDLLRCSFLLLFLSLFPVLNDTSKSLASFVFSMKDTTTLWTAVLMGSLCSVPYSFNRMFSSAEHLKWVQLGLYIYIGFLEENFGEIWWKSEIWVKKGWRWKGSELRVKIVALLKPYGIYRAQ